VTKPLKDETIDVVYGSWAPVTDNFFTECAAIAYVPPPILTNGILVRPRFIASALMRHEAWKTVKGFPEHLRSGEDLIFMNRVQDAGFRSVREANANVYWKLRPTLLATFKRFLVYSRNNIRAGLWRDWQATILSRYAVLFLMFAVLLLLNPRWAWIPVAFWFLMMIARAVVSIARNRSCYPATIPRNVARVVLIAFVLSLIDAGAIVGSIQWLFLDWARGDRKAAVEARNGA